MVDVVAPSHLRPTPEALALLTSVLSGYVLGSVRPSAALLDGTAIASVRGTSFGVRHLVGTLCLRDLLRIRRLVGTLVLRHSLSVGLSVRAMPAKNPLGVGCVVGPVLARPTRLAVGIEPGAPRAEELRSRREFMPALGAGLHRRKGGVGDQLDQPFGSETVNAEQDTAAPAAITAESIVMSQPLVPTVPAIWAVVPALS